MREGNTERETVMWDGREREGEERESQREKR